LNEPAKRRGRGRPPNTDRSRLIAEAAVLLLSEDGSRSLTHRRVDKLAGLPAGTTVHYAATRADLLFMAAQRLTEISISELKPFFDRLESRAGSLSPENLADEMLDLWRHRLAPEQFYRVRAEMAIFVSQDYEETLRPLYRSLNDAVFEGWRKALLSLGSSDPEETGLEFSLWTRGLFYMLSVLGGISSDEQERQLRSWVLRLINSLVADD
jgi:DNA-binding transcriptional regulator YbjK